MTVDVSAIVPVFNDGATIARAIDSALAQSFQGELEVIVINDGSTDKTPSILAAYGDRVKVVEQKNRGVAAARNAGVRASSGRYLAFLDADDAWETEKLATTIPILEDNPDIGLVYSDAALIDKAGQMLRDSHVPLRFRRDPAFDDLLVHWWYIFSSTVVMRRSLFHVCGGFDESLGRVHSGEDTYMWLLASEHSRIRFLPHSLVRCQMLRSEVTFQENPARHFEGRTLFAQLIGKRYGSRARKSIRSIKKAQARFAVSQGLLAMHDGKPQVARQNYLKSLLYWPCQFKLWFRLVATFLPVNLLSRIARLLPRRVGRALIGPPFERF
jgi:glycosyltransferase involved in cell wall biosynthesis